MSIFPESEYTRVFTGSRIIAQSLLPLLEAASIPHLLKDDDGSAIMGGFGVTAQQVRIFVHKTKLDEAQGIITKQFPDAH